MRLDLNVFNASGCRFRVNSLRSLIVAASLVTCLLAACSSEQETDQAALFSDSVELPGWWFEVAQMDLLVAAPMIVGVHTLASSGLQIAFTDRAHASDETLAQIDRAWQHMQQCLELLAASPLILLRDRVEPFTVADDVIHDFYGIPVASASDLNAGTVLQVSIEDFDSALGTPGFYTRSIIGRFLWLSAGLPERDYPYQCARDPSSNAGTVSEVVALGSI